MKICDYLELHPAVWHWAHMRLRCQCTLADALKYICDNDTDVQIIYANDPAAATVPAFSYLLSVLRAGRVWAVNLGEVEFSASQCAALTLALRQSAVAFMFVDAVLVGDYYTRLWKNIIQERRRGTVAARWLLSDDTAQNKIIRSCTHMWWPPLALGRNKRWSATSHRREDASIISRRETGEERRTC